MSRLWNIGLVICFLMAVGSFTSEAAERGDEVTINGMENDELVAPIVKLWDKPGRGNSVLGEAEHGSTVRVLDKHEHKRGVYYKVMTTGSNAGVSGWVHESRIEEETGGEE